MRLIDADKFGVISLQGKSEDFIEGVKFILEKIDEAPTVEWPHGEWVSSDAKRDKCSICDFKIGKYVGVFFNFCPNCGSPMNEKALEILRKREEGK